MDKGRITWRFDGEEPQAYAKPVPARPSSPGKPAVQEHGSVIPLFPEDLDGFLRPVPAARGRDERKEEADRIERLILESGTAAGKARERDAAGEAGPGVEGDEPVTLPDVAVYRRVRQPGIRGWPTLLLSGIGAILTGLLLGSFVFHFFRGEPVPAALPPGSAAEHAAAEAAGDPLGERSIPGETDGALPSSGADERDAGIPGGGVYRLPEKTYYVVQNGVFSSREGADAAAALLRDKGYAGAVEEGDKLAVYAGMADDRDDALLIARQLEAQKLDIFIKPVGLPAIDIPAGAWPGAETLAAYLAESRKLMDLVMDVSLGHLNESTPGSLTEGERADLKEAHRRWTEAASGLPEFSAAEAQNAVRSIGRAAGNAMAAMEQYGKTPSSAYLWQAQTALLDHLVAQKRVLEWLATDGSPGAGTLLPAGHPA
jgi:stage II sporulation protein B